MNFVIQFFNFMMHVDKYLDILVKTFGIWTYVILFFVIFCETGLVVTPFLPGDSMIFVVGALAASGQLHFAALLIMLIMAAILGDTANYHIGKFVGPKLFQKEHTPFLKKEYLLRTHAFYEKYGGKTIIIARFIPIVRTFAPFIAGMGEMHYGRFLSYNVVGGVVWVTLFLTAGYLFGNIPMVENNFSFVILAIIFLSLIPGVVTFIKAKRENKHSGCSED